MSEMLSTSLPIIQVAISSDESWLSDDVEAELFSCDNATAPFIICLHTTAVSSVVEVPLNQLSIVKRMIGSNMLFRIVGTLPSFMPIIVMADVAAVFLRHDRPEIGALLNGETLPLSGSAGAIAHRTILRERGGSRSAAGRQQSQQQKFSHSSPNKEISEEELPQGRPRSRNRPRRLLLSSTPISYFDFS